MCRRLWRLERDDITMKIPHTTYKRTTSRGFTIVETLVAVTILMIAVAGPLVVATRGLSSSLISRNQMIASYLAQESMEMVKNRRDNNIARYGDPETYWLYGFNYTSGACTSANPCDINGVDMSGSDPDVVTCDPTAGCTIYYASSLGYTHRATVSGAVKTGFTRRFYFQDRDPNNGKSEKTVHVFVNWYEGRVPYEIHLTSEIVATSR